MSATKNDVAKRTAADKTLTAMLEPAIRTGDPYRRCRMLADAVAQVPDDAVRHVAEKAFQAASECADAYRRVGAGSWALHAVIARGQEALAAQYLPGILADAQQIEPSPSQVEALHAVWEAVRSTPKLGDAALSLLVQACDMANTWRAGRIMRAVVTITVREDRAKAESLWARMPENRYKRQTRRMLDAGQVEPTRDYRGID